MRHSATAALIAGVFMSFNAQAMDLLEVYKEALANDAVYASARASLAAGQEKSTQGLAGLMPLINLVGSFVNNDYNMSRPLGAPDSNGYARTYTISLTQPLFRIANWEQYQQGKLSASLAEAQFAQAQQDLIVRVAQAYFDVLTAQDALATVQAQKEAITEQLASAKRNFEVGTATITDSQEAQARYDLAVAQEYATTSDLQIKQAALQQIIGKQAGALAGLRTHLTLTTPEPAAIEPWVENAEMSNYGVASQQLALEIAQRDVRRNRAGHYPTLDLIANHSYTNADVSQTSRAATTGSTSTVGVQWSIPLFAGFSTTSKVREAISLVDKARADLDNARRVAAQGARQAFLGVNSGLAQVRALEAAEISSQSALESNRLGYQVGVRINIDVLNAQQQLYSTRRDLARARYDTIVNGLRLKSASGSLKEEDLVQINGLLQH